MPRHTPGSPGQWRPRLDRRSFHYWWPSLLIGALTALLWIVAWPHGAVASRPAPWQPPEPKAAYVLVDANAQSIYLKPDIIARPMWTGFGRTIKYGPDDDEAVVEHQLPALDFLPNGVPTNFTVARLQAPLKLPNLAELPVEGVLPAKRTLPHETFALLVSLPLQKAAFTAAVSRAQLSAAEGHLRAWVELGEDGRISHILGEGTDSTAPDQRALRALRMGGGTNAAQGWVELRWSAETAPKPQP